MKRLATGILSGAMVLSLSAMTASATERKVEKQDVSRTEVCKTFSREDTREAKNVLFSENIDFESLMSERLASRGENVRLEFVEGEKRFLFVDGSSRETMMEEKAATRVDKSNISDMMTAKQDSRGDKRTMLEG